MRERDFQVCTKPTTRIVTSFKLVSLLNVVHQVDLDSKLHAQLFFGAVKVKSRDFLNLLVSILDGVVVQVHCIGCHLQVPAVLNNVDECFHKVGVVQLIVPADLVDVFFVKFLDAVVVLDTVQEFVDAKLGVEHSVCRSDG